LTVLTAGTRSPVPAELLGSERFGRLLQDAASRYDAVVIDTAPVLAVTDAALVARIADGVVVVARAKSTNRYALGRTIDQLRQVDAAVLGVVLNDVSPGEAYSGYGYGYRSYYSYSGEKSG
jgi:capsular exopolysaccharide synthesis family protein